MSFVIRMAVREIRANQTSILRSVERSEEVKELSERLVRVEQNLRNVEERHTVIQRDLESIRTRIERQPAGPALQLDPKKLNELIDARLRLHAERNRELLREPPPQR